MVPLTTNQLLGSRKYSVVNKKVQKHDVQRKKLNVTPKCFLYVVVSLTLALSVSFILSLSTLSTLHH